MVRQDITGGRAGASSRKQAVRGSEGFAEEQKIGLPKIGAGLGGGDWERISLIIDEELAEEDVTLVEYKP